MHELIKSVKPLVQFKSEILKISVIIPLFNKEVTILRAVNSVLNQTLPPSEIIIINDGSTDRSGEIVKSIKDSRIKLYSQNNSGVSGARNKGIEQARSEYISFLDADDEWLPEFLSTINELILKYPEAVGYGTSYYKKYNNNFQLISRIKKIQFHSKIGLIKNYFEVCINSDPPICASSVCIKKKNLLKVGGFPIGIAAGEDILTWARLSQLGSFAYSTTPLAIYHQPIFNPTLNPPSADDYVGIELNKILTGNIFMSGNNYLKQYIGKWHKMRAALFLITGKNKSAFYEIKQSIMFNGLTIKLFIYLFLIFFRVRTRYKILFPEP